MLHLREYYERALREFGSADSGKEIFFSPPNSLLPLISIRGGGSCYLFCCYDCCHAEWSQYLWCMTLCSDPTQSGAFVHSRMASTELLANSNFDTGWRKRCLSPLIYICEQYGAIFYNRK